MNWAVKFPYFWTTAFDGYDPDGDNFTVRQLALNASMIFDTDLKMMSLSFREAQKYPEVLMKMPGILTLSGIATAKEYVEAIRSIKYNYVDVKELEAEHSSPVVSTSA